LRIKGEALEHVGSVDSSRWAMLYGNQVYTIEGNVFHTQSVDLQLPFTASRIAAIDGKQYTAKTTVSAFRSETITSPRR